MPISAVGVLAREENEKPDREPLKCRQNALPDAYTVVEKRGKTGKVPTTDLSS